MRLSQLAGCVVVGICPLLFLPELPTPLAVQVIIGGAILMSLSTIIVAANAQLLRRLDLAPDAIAGAVNEGSSNPPSQREPAL